MADCPKTTHPLASILLKGIAKASGGQAAIREQTQFERGITAMGKTPFTGNIDSAPTTYFNCTPSGDLRESKAVTTRLHGLCSTCNRSAECSYIAGHDRPILHCEEFDGSGPVNPRRPAPKSTQKTETRRSTLMGLCCNCAQVETCCFRKPEGGVWQCEEYE